MTTYAVIGGEQWEDFATTRGHGDFVRWTDTLDPGQYPLLAHLADWGWVNEIDKLEDEIERALEENKPFDSLAKTLQGFLEILSRREAEAESVMLTNGLTPEEDGDGEWWIEGKPVSRREAEGGPNR